MSRLSLGSQLKPHDSFVRTHHSVGGRFANDPKIKSFGTCGKGPGSHLSMFLVHKAGQLDLCLFGSVRGSDQIHESIEHGGNASLGIAGSPAVEPSVLEEWGQLLCVGHHRIHVRGEQQAVTGTFRGSIGQKKVFASALDGLIAHGKTFSPTQFRKKRSHPTFT